MEFDFKIPSEDLLDDIGFLGAQHAVVDEDAGELLADGLVNQSRSNAGVNAATKAKDHLVLADLLADFFHGLINVVAHCPFAATATNLVNEIGNDGLSLGGVNDLGVELQSVKAGLGVFDRGKA